MKKKVLFLITKSNWGGAQRYVYDLAAALDKEIYEVVVALGGDGELKEKLEGAGIKTVVLSQMVNTLSAKKLFSIVKEVAALLQIERPGILHCNSSIAGFAGVVSGRRAGIQKVLYTAHGWAFNEDRSFFQKLIFTFFHWLTVFLSHQTIAVSETTKQQLHGPFITKKWVVIHNGRHPVDFVPREAARKKLQVSSETLLTGTIGELHPVKQHKVMIRAVAQLHNNNQKLHHVIIGAGPAEQELKKLAVDLEVQENITFTGAIHEAAQYLKAFDVYVQPSRSEALGFTVIEAAQAGLPIVASKVGGIPEIITQGKNGVLVPSGDVETFSSTIEDLLNHPSKRDRLGQAALETSVQFSFVKMLQKTMAVYDSNTTPSAKAASRATD